MERELTALFGPEVLQECWQIPASINSGQARKVGKLAGVLTNANPRRQITLIKAMPLDDRLLLCRWLADRDYGKQCISG